MSKKKTIGIIGGMGPMATYDLAEKIVECTDAEVDQDHIHVITDCNTAIPDRTAAILSKGKSPVPEIVKSANRLVEAGADILIMPCNTAHYFYDEIVSQIKKPILNMPEIAAEELSYLGIQKAAVLATEGTVKSGVYEKALAARDIEAVYPDEEGQELLMTLIYEFIKAGNMDFSTLPLEELVEELVEEGAEALILGCTELPLAFEVLLEAGEPEVLKEEGILIFDPTLELAKAAVLKAGGFLK